MGAFGKRVDGPGGRRHAARTALSLPASMFSVEHSRVVILDDLSASGARLSGPDLPAEHESVWIRVGPIDAFGTVVWNEAASCGITFDRPLGDEEADFAKREARSAQLTRLAPEQRQALEDWLSGSVD